MLTSSRAKHLIPFLLLLLLVLQSCSDDSVSPNSGDGNDNGNADFAIVSVDQDTVYWGDTVTVRLAKMTADSFTVFLHTVPAEAKLQWRDTSDNAEIRFRVPLNASTGQIRVFERGTHQAKGDRSLTIVPQVAALLKTEFDPYGYPEAYVGDLIVITGKDIPLRRRDIAVFMEGMEMPIDEWDTSHIFMRVPEQAKSGRVEVRVFDEMHFIGRTEIHQGNGQLMKDARLTMIGLAVDGLDGFYKYITEDADTIIDQITEPLSGWVYDVTLNQLANQSTSDSTIFSGKQRIGQKIARVDVRLKNEPGNRVSGKIRAEYDEGLEAFFMEAEVSKMRWMPEEGGYELYAVSQDVAEQLVSFSVGLITPDNFSERFVYQTAGADSFFRLHFYY